MPAILRGCAYLWAAPATILGLLLVAAGLLTGGRARLVQGAIEAEGGAITWLLRQVAAAAMTIGHVIIGRDLHCLEHSRAHEWVHVRQYERWGPGFIPMYFLYRWILWSRGLDPYLDNPFEREAFEKTEGLGTP